MSILNLNGPSGRAPRSKSAVKVWMGIGLVIAVLGVGSTLASTITINGNNKTEFGQGVQKTVYCGGKQSITVTPVSQFLNKKDSLSSLSSGSSDDPTSSNDPTSSDNSAGSFYLSGIKVSDIPSDCSGVDFVLSVYDLDGTPTPVVISSGDNPIVQIKTPTVYWVDAKKPGSQLRDYGGLLSNNRDSYDPQPGLMSLVVNPRDGELGSFEIQFLDLGSTVHAFINDVGRIVIETQNDTFGAEALAASTQEHPILLTTP